MYVLQCCITNVRVRVCTSIIYTSGNVINFTSAVRVQFSLSALMGVTNITSGQMELKERLSIGVSELSAITPSGPVPLSTTPRLQRVL